MGNIMDDWFGIDQPKKPQPKTAEQTAQEQQKYNAEQASQQAKYNLDALRTNIAANRVDQTSPFASLTWSPSGTDQWGNTTYSATTQLSPENQALLEQLFQNREGIGGTAGNLIQSLLSSDAYGANGLPDLTSAIQPMMDRQLDYLNPYFDHQTENRLNELRNRGLEAGNPAFDYEMMNLQQQQDRSVGDYLNKFTNTAMDLWKMPISGIQQLMGMTGPVTGDSKSFGFVDTPSVSMAAPTVGNVDFISAQKNAQDAANEAYKQQLAQYNSTMGTIGSGLGMFLGAPSGTLLGGLSSALGGGLAGMLGLQQGNAPMPIMGQQKV